MSGELRDKVLEAAARQGQALEQGMTTRDHLELLQRRLSAIRDATTAALADVAAALERETKPQVPAGVDDDDAPPCPTGHADTVEILTRGGKVILCGDCNRQWPKPSP